MGGSSAPLMSAISGVRMEAAFPHCPRSPVGFFGGKRRFPPPGAVLGAALCFERGSDRIKPQIHIAGPPGLGKAKTSRIWDFFFFFFSFPRLAALPPPQLSQIPGCQRNNGGLSGDLAGFGLGSSSRGSADLSRHYLPRAGGCGDALPWGHPARSLQGDQDPLQGNQDPPRSPNPSQTGNSRCSFWPQGCG